MIATFHRIRITLPTVASFETAIRLKQLGNLVLNFIYDLRNKILNLELICTTNIYNVSYFKTRLKFISLGFDFFLFNFQKDE